MLNDELQLLLHLRVTPGAKREAILGVHKGRLSVAVKAEAERNEANEALIALLSAFFELPIRALRLTRGHRSNHKTVLLRCQRLDRDRMETKLLLFSPLISLLSLRSEGL